MNLARIETGHVDYAVEDFALAPLMPFVQVGRSSTLRGEGVGFGLAISRDLARGMCGNLTAASTPGDGTTFTLTLPSSIAAALTR